MRDQEESCSDMSSSLAINGTAEATGVTRFANEACDGVMVNARYVKTPFLDNQGDLQDLKDYFTRPRLFNRGTVAFASRATLVAQTINLTFLTATFPQWANRLSGVYGVRFTMCFRLQVAVTAFHQGLISVNFEYGQNGTTSSYRRGSNSATSTNIPHVRLDVTESTMVELKVPFVYPAEFYPVASPDSVGGIIGTFGVNPVLNFISVSGLSAPTYETYMWLEDLEFYGADYNNTTTITLQSGVIAKEMRNSKLLSSTLTKGAEVSSFIARHVPMLSSLAGPTAWFLDIGAGIAKYFGYSRPILQDPVMRVVRHWYSSESNVDLPYAGFVVGPMASNTLAFDGVAGGTDVDEMSLSFVTSQWSQICLGSLATTNTHGTVVYASPVSPACFWFRAPSSAPFCNNFYPVSTAGFISNTGNSIIPSSLMNIASYFRLWRGSIKFRFTFAKTKFHGGRYMVSFNPKTNVQVASTAFNTIDGPETVSGLVQPYGLSLIMDLKDGNVFEFLVPYMTEQPWVTFHSAVGSISVVCIDPLQAASSVTATVPFMVEVCGGNDFELADYAGNIFVPTAVSTIYQQSGDIVAKGSDTAVGINAVFPSATTDPSQHTVGEKILSVKQMLQIPSYTTSIVGATTTGITYLPPFFQYNGPANLIASGNTLPLSATFDWTGSSFSPGSLAKIYAFARGSTDYHVYFPNAAPNSIAASLEQLPFQGRLQTTGINSLQLGPANTASTPKVIAYSDAPFHVRLPSYQLFARVWTWILDTTIFPRKFNDATFNLTQTALGNYYRLRVSNNGISCNMWLSSSAGDDAMLAGYLGPCPVLIPNALGANPIYNDWLSP